MVEKLEWDGELSEIVYWLRMDRGWSQQDLGDRVGVTKQAVGQWEVGKTMPTGSHVVTLYRMVEGMEDDDDGTI